MKTEYDKRHRTKDPDFKVGQQVLLKDVRIAPGSNKILTKRPYSQQPCSIVSRTAALQGGRQNLKAEKNQWRDRISSPV